MRRPPEGKQDRGALVLTLVMAVLLAITIVAQVLGE
jgi:hypothetical protein